MLCGGLTPGIQAVNPQIQAIAAKHKDDAEKHLNTTFSTWEAVGFSTQVVAGTNYMIKVHTGNQSYVHIKVYQPLPHTG